MRKLTTSDPEIAALHACVKHLSCLDEDARLRVVEYLSQRYIRIPDDLIGNILGKAASEETDSGGRYKVKLFPLQPSSSS